MLDLLGFELLTLRLASNLGRHAIIPTYLSFQSLADALKGLFGLLQILNFVVLDISTLSSQPVMTHTSYDLKLKFMIFAQTIKDPSNSIVWLHAR